MKKSVLTFVTALCLSPLFAQPDVPSPGAPGGGAPAPFGFVELLIAAGAAYGGKKMYDKNKEGK